jgi:hypothetical protein
MTFNVEHLTYPILTVCVTVVLIIVIRKYGKLPVSSMGPDLNFLTYGFLWDTTVKGFKGENYWPYFHPLIGHINKPTTLFIIAVFNLMILGSNMKLAFKTENMTDGWRKKWVAKPLVSAAGCVSLIIFLWVQATWEAAP